MRNLIAILLSFLLLPILAFADEITDETLSGEWYMIYLLDEESKAPAAIAETGEICIENEQLHIKMSSDLTYDNGYEIMEFTRTNADDKIILHAETERAHAFILIIPDTTNEYIAHCCGGDLWLFRNGQAIAYSTNEKAEYYLEENKLFFITAGNNTSYLRGKITQIYPSILRYEISDGEEIFFIKPTLFDK